jgi:hypothetical protein
MSNIDILLESCDATLSNDSELLMNQMSQEFDYLVEGLILNSTEPSKMVLRLVSNSSNNQYHNSYDRGGGHDRDI